MRALIRTKVFFRRHGFRAWVRTFSPPTFGLHSVTSLFVSEKRGAKSSLFWTRTYNFWGNACMKGENDFVTIWTNPTEPVLKLCFTLFEATSSTILCIGLSFTSQNYQNWEPELYLFRLLTYVSCIIALPKCGQNFRRSVDPTEKNLGSNWHCGSKFTVGPARLRDTRGCQIIV